NVLPAPAYCATAAASARFSAALDGPSGSSGSANTRAARSSASVGASENTGSPGGALTRGTVRLTATGRFASTGAAAVAGPGAFWPLVSTGAPTNAVATAINSAPPRRTV